MPDAPKLSRPVRLVVPAALLLVFATAVYVWSGRLARRPDAAPPPAEAPATAEIDDAVERALRLAGVDSTRKNEWVDDIPGADVTALSAGQRERFVRLANTLRCSCGCGFTLAACRAFDPTCEDSAPRLAELADSVAAGHYASARGLRERPVRAR
jgi:hypothetical protein